MMSASAPEPRIVIAVRHAAFAPERVRSLERLLARLAETAPGCPVVVARDEARRGATWSFKEAAVLALGWQDPGADPRVMPADGWKPGIKLADMNLNGATHVVFLPDDVMTCLSFETALRGIVHALPDQVVDFYLNTNHPATEIAGARFYTQDMASAGFLVFPRGLLEEHLAWRDEHLRERLATDDLGVNLWALLTGRKIHKPVMSLVDHDTHLPSLVGNDDGQGEGAWRKPRHVVMDAKFFGPGTWDTREIPHLGRQSTGSHWQALYAVRPEGWDLPATFQAERHGRPVSAEPRVMIATPVYAELHPRMAASRAAVIEALRLDGISADYLELKGHSDIFRARQFLATQFLCSDANIFLQWDADLEVLNPEAAVAMLRMVHQRPLERGVIGGSYPFRDGSRGRVVASPVDPAAGPRTWDRRADGTVAVGEIGTGFLACSRAGLEQICAEHPELLYSSQSPNPSLFGQPMWALFDSLLVEDEAVLGGRRRLTEDYAFCRRAWDAAVPVAAFAPLRLRHWAGDVPHDGNIAEAWSFEPARGRAAVDPRERETKADDERVAERAGEPMAFDAGADHAGALVQRGAP